MLVDVEAIDDPATVRIPDIEALVASARDLRDPEPLDDEPGEPDIPSISRFAFVLPSPESDLMSNAALAAGVALVIGLLVLVAVVGMVGGLGLGIAIANVVG